MFRVSGNQISITAGDTALMAICPDETGYVPTANDRAIFTVRERPERRALIEKTIAPEADGRFVVCFESEDTARLKPREYVWDVRLAIQANVDENGEVTDAEQSHHALSAGNPIRHGGDWRAIGRGKQRVRSAGQPDAEDSV